MKSRKFFAGLLAAAMACGFAGCSDTGSKNETNTGEETKDDATTDETKDDAQDEKKDDKTAVSSDGALIAGTTQELAGVFSPIYYTTAYDGWVVDMIYQSMLAYDANSELYCQLASEMPTVSEDGSKITYKLKDGMKFSDGSDLNADDVKFTFTLMADPEYKGARNDGVFNFIEGWSEYQDGDAEEVSGIKVIDPTTIEFSIASPNIDAVNLIGGFAIMPNDQFEYSKGNMGGYKDKNDQPIGSGPYVLSSFEKAAGAALTKNENYTGEGDYKIEKVIVKTIGTATELASLQNGDINYLPESIEANIIGPASLDDTLTNDHYFRAAEGYIGFNCAAGPTADPAVRQALSYATDRQAFVDAFYKYPEASEEVSEVKLGYVPTAFWTPVGDTMGDYTTGKESLDGLVNYEYDLDKAKQILDDAGWKPGANGIREKDGQTLTIKFLASEGNSVLDMLMPMIISSWGDLGVDLKQNTVDFNTLISTVEIGSDASLDDWSAFFMATSFNGLSNTDMNDLLGYEGDLSDPQYRGSNYVRIADEDLNKYLNDGKNTADEATSIENYKKAMVRESELAPYLPMYGNTLFNIYSTNVHDVNTGPVCKWSQALADAYID